MKKKIFIFGVLLLLYACGSNSIESIYEPITKKQMEKVVAAIDKNKECLINLYGGESQINLSVMSISAAQQSDAATIAIDTEHCFGDTYSRCVSDSVDQFILTQRIYIVRTLYNKPERTFYLDKNFKLIPTRNIADDECACDCWE